MNLSYASSFLKQVKKCDSCLQEEVFTAVELFQQNPPPPHPSLKTHKLQGKLAGRWSFPVNYKIRIVFEYLSEESVVLLAIGSHDVYKR